jgi:hypothetical protein
LLIECPCQSGSEPNQDFARTPSHPSGALPPSVNDSFSSSSVRPHPRLPHLAFQKSVPGFALHLAHTGLTSHARFLSTPFLPLYTACNPKHARVHFHRLAAFLGNCDAWIRCCFGPRHISPLSCPQPPPSRVPSHLSRIERIASWRPQSLDCASCQVSNHAVHVPNTILVLARCAIGSRSTFLAHANIHHCPSQPLC